MKIHDRKKMLILLAAILLLFAVSLCIKVMEEGFTTPGEAFVNLFTWVRLKIAKLTHSSFYMNRYETLAGMDSYVDTVQRFKLSVLTFICGALLALAGSIFQTVFRNPIAAPTMLGVSTGVRCGILILVLKFQGAAMNMPLEKYLYCYSGALIMLVLVFGAGKLFSGKGKLNILDMLIVASVISQLVGAILSYYMNNMDNDMALLFQNVSNAIIVNVEPISFILLGVAVALTVIPMFALRYRFNTMSFTGEEAKSMGVNSPGMRLFTLALASLMVVAAMVHCGSVGMVSLIVPFITRGLFGANFEKNFWGNILLGGGLLLLCRDLIAFIDFGSYGMPIGTLTDFIALPVFVLILAAQRRIWE